jgi:1-acyl-sn-glycerol-3-phosphate acyltransferase
MPPEPLVPELPPALPRKGNVFSRCLGRCLLRMLGWRIEGELPNQPKMVVAVGLHTSNWDFLVAMAVILALGIRVNYLMKKEAFIWPFTRIFVWLGGVPLDRRSTANTVEQLVIHYRQADKLWVVITPDGTRKKVESWKTGFLRIAAGAEVPVLVTAWDYSRKVFVIDRVWATTQDHAADAAKVRNYLCGHFCGRHPQNQ